MNQTMTLTFEQINLIINHYQDQALNNTHSTVLFRANIQGATLTIYRTGKLLLQGANCLSLENDIQTLLGLSVTKQIQPLGQAIIGSDEVGTGDYFGPITVCSCLVPLEDMAYFQDLGLKDSKKISDPVIKRLAPLIMKRISYSVVILHNQEYNTVMKKDDMNMNKIKAILHYRAIQKMLDKHLPYDDIIVDGFTTPAHFNRYLANQPSLGVPIHLIEKAEDQYLSVAAASIIARYTFLDAFESLRVESGYPLPKGAGPLVDAMIRTILADHPLAYLQEIAKINFKNTQKAQK
ncbi:MAG: ribonuclease HIII [Bacilli bacterium]